jgi:microcystin-dependent protein
MSEPFLAEVKIFGFNFPPRGWAQCDGQILPIAQNQSLYSLLGTTFGGDGRTTFALPDLRGRTPIHEGTAQGGTSYPLGQPGGEERHTLNVQEIPNHTHVAQATSATPPSSNQVGALLAPSSGGRRPMSAYAAPSNPTALASGSIGTVGGQSHENIQPSLALSFCIALQGLFPSRN